jgi:hypothetical protein
MVQTTTVLADNLLKSTTLEPATLLYLWPQNKVFDEIVPIVT